MSSRPRNLRLAWAIWQDLCPPGDVSLMPLFMPVLLTVSRWAHTCVLKAVEDALKDRPALNTRHLPKALTVSSCNLCRRLETWAQRWSLLASQIENTESISGGWGGLLLTGLHLGTEPDPPCQQSCAYGPISEPALLLRPLYVLEASAILLKSLLASALHVQWTVPEMGVFWWPPLRVEKIFFYPLTLFIFGANNHSSKSKASSIFSALWTVTYLHVCRYNSSHACYVLFTSPSFSYFLKNFVKFRLSILEVLIWI